MLSCCKNTTTQIHMYVQSNGTAELQVIFPPTWSQFMSTFCISYVLVPLLEPIW